MGLNNIYYYALGYMLETMFLGCCLLYILYYYLLKIDAHRNFSFLTIFSENNNKPCKKTDILSAENCKGFSETTRLISDLQKNKGLKEFFKCLNYS